VSIEEKDLASVFVEALALGVGRLSPGIRYSVGPPSSFAAGCVH
jgi:hypothetical protein